MAKAKKSKYAWAAIRIVIGLIFMWAFFDKMIGLGYSTCNTVDPATKENSVKVLCEKSVAKGASPTAGFLGKGTTGPFKGVFNEMAGNKIVDFLFMAGLLLVGLSLVLGIGIKVAAISGALLMMLMWLAVLPKTTNPLLDDHVVYALALFGIMFSNHEQVWGLGNWWQKQPIVKKYPILA